MKLYVKAFSSYRNDEENLDIKKELKQKYKLDVRRQDEFIYLATLGAQRLKEVTEISVTDELYVTSGLGNIGILQRAEEYVTQLKQFIRPFDFINMLGNTTSYYVASSLGVKDKNIFQISDNFTYINTLISIYASLKVSEKEAILGSIDLQTNPPQLLQSLLGIEKETKIISATNYQKLSLSNDNALASIEFDIKSYTYDEIKNLLSKENSKIIVSNRCQKLSSNEKTNFFETIASNVVNNALKEKLDVLFVDCYEDKYKILKIRNLV